MLWLTGTGELVVFAVEHAQAGGHAAVGQGGVHLQAFRQGAAVVFIGMDEQRGGDHIGGVAQGRLLPQFFGVVEGVAVALIGGEEIADVRQLEMERWEAAQQKRWVWPMIQLVIKPP